MAVDPNTVVERVVLWSGGRQSGVVGRPLAAAAIVQVPDGSGSPVPGALVRFAMGTGGGSDRSVGEIPRTVWSEDIAFALALAPLLTLNTDRTTWD